MNLNVSLWGFLTWLAYYIIAGFFLRFLSAKFPDSPIGKAVLFING
jgi:hypothetical protein